ncbi:MAG: DUF1298 domain-containing protein [bacterium]|nr:DUF1298 domain-containing protein [bacterium]
MRPEVQPTMEPSGPGTFAQVSDASLLPMRPQDSMWLQDQPTNLMIVNSVFTIDSMNLDTLRQLWQERVIDLDGGHRYRRFTWRVVRSGRRLCWQKLDDFDLARHVIEAPGADRIDSRESLQDYVGTVAARPLPRDRPLWQMQIIPEFVEGSSAIFFRVHHCMGDGISMVPILFALMDRDNPEVEQFADPKPVGAGKSGRSKLAVWLWSALVGPFVMLRKALALRDRSSMHGPECSGVKRVAWTDPIDLDLIKKVKNALGATVNDVLMACVTGAFERCARARNGKPLKRLRVSMPVNVRWPTEPLEMENRFATVLLKLPAGVSDVRERVFATKRRVDRLKRSVEPMVMFGAQNLLLSLLPAGFGRRLADFFGNKTTSVLTNVPGPQVPLSIGGRRLRGMVFWVPQRGLIGIGVSILSCSGQVRVGVIADTVLLPDPGELVAAFEAELAELRETLGL